MTDFSTSKILTDDQKKAFRLLCITREGLPEWSVPREVMDQLVDLGLASQATLPDTAIVFHQTELGIGYARSLGWRWDFYGEPNFLPRELGGDEAV